MLKFNSSEKRDVGGRWTKGDRVVLAGGRMFGAGPKYNVTKRSAAGKQGHIIEVKNGQAVVQTRGGVVREFAQVDIQDLQAAPELHRKPNERLRHALDQPKDMFTADERTAIRKYTGGNKGAFGYHMGASGAINQSLRGGHNPNDVRLRKIRDDLDSAFSKVAPLGKPDDDFGPYKVFRTTHVPKARSLKPGDKITEPAYVSTSSAKTVGESFNTAGFSERELYEIELPAGTKAIDVNEAAGSAYGGEREVLLPRGSQFEVTGVEPSKVKGYRRVIRLKHIPR